MVKYSSRVKSALKPLQKESKKEIYFESNEL